MDTLKITDILKKRLSAAGFEKVEITQADNKSYHIRVYTARTPNIVDKIIDELKKKHETDSRCVWLHGFTKNVTSRVPEKNEFVHYLIAIYREKINFNCRG